MAGDAKCTGRADQADVGQTFQPDVRLESLTYSMHSSAVPMRAEACPRREAAALARLFPRAGVLSDAPRVSQLRR